MQGTGNPHLPNFTWKDVHKFSSTPKRRHEIGIDGLMKNPQKYVVLLDYNISQQLKKANAINADTTYVYSMWSGYKEKYQDWFAYLADNKVQMTDIHTSGHADIPTLKRWLSVLVLK